MPRSKAGTDEWSAPGDPDYETRRAEAIAAGVDVEPEGRPIGKAALPPRVAEILARELSRSHAGSPILTVTAQRTLYAALRPLEADLAERLAPCERLADGTLRLLVARSLHFRDAHLSPGQFTIKVNYDPRTGRWISDVAAGQPGFARLAAHVWRLRGRDDGRMAEIDLFALIGLAYLYALKEGAA